MLVAILGMHRSGTSAVAGMLADHGLEFGRVRERNRFNRRGNREIPELNELHEAILERGGGTWWRPPAEVAVRAGDLRRRNKILGAIEGDPIAVKDPRMLVCRALWSDLELSPIGVIRNPVAVRSSLARRADAVSRPPGVEDAAPGIDVVVPRHRLPLRRDHRDPRRRPGDAAGQPASPSPGAAGRRAGRHTARTSTRPTPTCAAPCARSSRSPTRWPSTTPGPPASGAPRPTTG